MDEWTSRQVDESSSRTVTHLVVVLQNDGQFSACLALDSACSHSRRSGVDEQLSEWTTGRVVEWTGGRVVEWMSCQVDKSSARRPPWLW